MRSDASRQWGEGEERGVRKSFAWHYIARHTSRSTTSMNTEEYANLERVERDHWYYAGKRDFVRRWIARVRRLQPHDTLLDCGAGTGKFADEMRDHCHVLVLDDHEESLRRLRERFPAERVLTLTEGRIPLDASSVDVVTALDVLEHVPDDAGAVRDFHRVLRPGGLAVITVPASMALWSDWDVVLHHHRRYDRQSLRALFPRESWEIVHANYTNTLLYPAVWGVRRFRRWFPAAPNAERAEDKVPAPWLNRLLRALFVRTALWRLPMPFGVSLVLIARRRGH